jgi:hypothetical protein
MTSGCVRSIFPPLSFAKKKVRLHARYGYLFNQCILVELGARTSQRLLFSAMQGQGYKDTDIAFSHFLRTKFMDHAFVFQKRAKLGMVWQGLRLADAGGDYF